MIVTAAAGLKIPSVSQGKGPNGETWRMAKEKRIDKIIYPEAEGTFKVAMEAVLTGKPYPIKAAFFVGTTMFQREANSEELAEGLKNLNLVSFKTFSLKRFAITLTMSFLLRTSWKEWKCRA